VLLFLPVLFLKRRHKRLLADPLAALGRQHAVRIFSFLDPRSLSRCARVSWAWHDVSMLDSIWRSKCISRGWPLPYTPSAYESGAWRSWYVQCVAKIDAMAVDAQRQAENSITSIVDAIKRARLAEQRSRAKYRAAQAVETNLPSPESEDEDEGEESEEDEDRDTIAPEHRILRRHTRECELRLLSMLQQQGLQQFAPYIFSNAGRSADSKHATWTPAGGHAGAGRTGHGGGVDAASEWSEFEDRTSGRRAMVSRALEAIEELIRRRVAETRNARQQPWQQTGEPLCTDLNSAVSLAHLRWPSSCFLTHAPTHPHTHKPTHPHTHTTHTHTHTHTHTCTHTHTHTHIHAPTHVQALPRRARMPTTTAAVAMMTISQIQKQHLRSAGFARLMRCQDQLAG
jgi:hypothetical protein